jgi:O-antigen/teichoic acid export membrane protein
MLSPNFFRECASVKLDIALVALLKVWNQAVAIVASILIARSFTAVELGQYALFMALTNVLLIVGAMGTNTSFMKEMAALELQGRYGTVSTFASFRSINVLVVLPIAAMVALLLSAWRVTLFAYLVFAALQLAHLFAYSKRAEGRYLASEVLEWGAFRAFAFLSVLVAIVLGGFDFFFLILLLGVVVLLAFTLYFWYGYFSLSWMTWPQYWRILSTSLPFFVVHAVSMLLIYTDTFAIKVILGLEALAYYDVAYKLAMAILFLNTAITSVIAPNIARWHSQGNYKQIKRVLWVYVQAAALASAFVFAAGLVLSEEVLGLWGDEYRAVSDVFLILLAGALVQFIFGGTSVYLSMAGYQTVAARIALAAGLANVILNVVLIPVFGLVGAAAATALSISIVAVFGVVYVAKYVSINDLKSSYNVLL